MAMKRWCQNLFSGIRPDFDGRSTNRKRRRFARLEVESLENRFTPTMTFSNFGGVAPPDFGSPTVVNYNQGQLYGKIPIYLIFQVPTDSGVNYDSGIFGYDKSVSANEIIGAVNTILSSNNYLSGLDQYYPVVKFGGVNLFPPPQPYVAGTYLSYYPLPTTFTDGQNDDDINNLVSDSIAKYLPEPDDTTPNGIYVVFTRPGYDLYPEFSPPTQPVASEGYGNTGGFGDEDSANDMAVTSNPVFATAAGTDPPFSNIQLSAIDSITTAFSHVLVGTVTDPVPTDSSGVPSGFFDPVPGPFISGPAPNTYSDDFAPDLTSGEAEYYVGYENGFAVQSYWSQESQQFIIPRATQYNVSVNYGILSVSRDLAGPLSNASVAVSSTSSGGVELTVNGDTTEFDPGQVTSIDVSLGGGTNTVDLQAVPSGVTSITVQGAGNTTLEAPGGSADVWHNTGTGSGTLDIGTLTGIVSFSGITNEQGGGNDDFMFQGGSVPGFVDGGPGPGVATLDYSALSVPVNVNLQTATADDIGGTFSNINNFVGSTSSGNTLTGPDATWDINGANSGTVNGSTFSSFANLTGGSGADQFVFFPGGSIFGNIDGGGGTNTLDYSNLAGPVTVNLQTATAPGIGGTFANINNFIGSASSDDTLIGPDAGATWDSTGTNSGTVNGSTFSSFENLTGGSGADQFVFFHGGSVSGNIDGGGGTNTLDYSNLTTPVTLNLQSDTATGIGGTFANITNFIGGSGANTLTGPNADTVWNLTGLNMLTVNGLSFSGFQNLVGGSGADRFVFQTGGGVSGSIDGGAGNNTLDYFPYVGNITVDLALGTATGVGGGISNVENVTGSIGNDLLVGDALPNVLVGGTGRNVIIGGGGADTVVGGGGDNLLIGGSTAYDTDLTALTAIMAEWTRTDLSFEQRVADLISNAPPARALNGAYHLNKKTVFDDDVANVLTGGGGLDWFFAGSDDSILNRKPGDHITGE
jgi:hypothetical protein